MGFLSRSGSILAASISREANWWQPLTTVAGRVLISFQFRHVRNNHGDGAALRQESGEVEQQPRHVLSTGVDVSFVSQASSRSLEVDAVRNGCTDGELNSQVGFRAFSYAAEYIQHIGDHILVEVEDRGCKSFEVGHVKEINYKGLLSDMEQRTGCAYGEIMKDSEVRVLACGEVMQDSIGGSTGEMLYESSEISTPSNKSKSILGEEMKDTTPTDQIEPVQSNEVNAPLNNPPSNCAHPEGNSSYPVPLSPFSGELAKGIEYERAMVAEAAMKSGPAMTRSEVLFEDEWLMVINKPSGMYCEHVLATVPSLLTPTSALQARESSLSRLTLRRPVDNKDTSIPHLHMANRLDRDTSGVMVITKCRPAAGKLSNVFTKRQVQKSYIALCRGSRPSWRSLTVDSGHGRSRYGAWRVYPKRDVGRGLPGGSVVRDMTTHLLVMAINKQLVVDEQVVGSNVLEKLKDVDYVITAGDESSNGIFGQSPDEKLNACSEDSSHNSQASTENDEVVIRALPVTGRTHQIRLHCQFVGLPLRGDVKYGGPHFLNGVRYDHHALHAESLSFRHPFTFEELHFVAPLPEWATDAGVLPLVL